jgi:hypothetical protein
MVPVIYLCFLDLLRPDRLKPFVINGGKSVTILSFIIQESRQKQVYNGWLICAEN